MSDFQSFTLPMVSLSEAQQRAKAARRRLELPAFEIEPDLLAKSLERSIDQANERLDAIASLSSERLDFSNTVGALDDLLSSVHLVANRLYLMKETVPEETMREEAGRLYKQFQDWDVGLEYRERTFIGRFEPTPIDSRI